MGVVHHFRTPLPPLCGACQLSGACAFDFVFFTSFTLLHLLVSWVCGTVETTAAGARGGWACSSSFSDKTRPLLWCCSMSVARDRGSDGMGWAVDHGVPGSRAGWRQPRPPPPVPWPVLPLDTAAAVCVLTALVSSVGQLVSPWWRCFLWRRPPRHGWPRPGLAAAVGGPRSFS